PLGVADLTNRINVSSGYSNIVWRNKLTGEIRYWILDSSGNWVTDHGVSWSCGPECIKQWSPVGFADFDGDGFRDLLWFDATRGFRYAWLLNGSGGVGGQLKLSLDCPANNGCSGLWKPIAAVSVRYRSP